MDKSLLDLESARKRLEELDQERAAFLDLIKKLKEVKDGVEPLLNSLKLSEEKIKKREEELERLISSAKNALANFEERSDELIDDLGTRADAITDNASSYISQLKKAFIEFSDKKAEEINMALTGMKSDFNKLKDEQIDKLDQISKTYERIRASYDTMKNMVDSIELSISTINKDIQNTKSETMVISQAVEKIDKALSDIDQTYEKLFTKNKDELNSINNRLNESRKNLIELIAQKEKLLIAKIKKQKIITFAAIVFLLLIILGVFLMGLH